MPAPHLSLPELQLLTQTLDALTRKYQKAARAKAMFVGMAMGKFQMLALTATATELPASKGAWSLPQRGLFDAKPPVLRAHLLFPRTVPGADQRLTKEPQNQR